MPKDFYPPDEISPLGEFLAECHFRTVGKKTFPIDPEIIATKYFGLDIQPSPRLMSVGVKSGIDTTQSVIFVDETIYMVDRFRHFSNQAIAHELAHALFDVSLLRQMAGASTIEDAFERHTKLVEGNSGIESRAHMLAGSFLVPRSELLKQVLEMLIRNYDKAMKVNPDLTVEEMFKSMASSQLGRHFCQSEDVLLWRLKDERIHEALDATLETPIRNLNPRYLAKVAGSVYKPEPLSDRLKALLPADLITQYDLSVSMA